jgi:hypothetical protein
MPVPASVPLETAVTATLNQPFALPLHEPPLQRIDIVGAVRSDSPLAAGLLALVKKPAPCAIFVWTV